MVDQCPAEILHRSCEELEVRVVLDDQLVNGFAESPVQAFEDDISHGRRVVVYGFGPAGAHMGSYGLALLPPCNELVALFCRLLRLHEFAVKFHGRRLGDVRICPGELRHHDALEFIPLSSAEHTHHLLGHFHCGAVDGFDGALPGYHAAGCVALHIFHDRESGVVIVCAKFLPQLVRKHSLFPVKLDDILELISKILGRLLQDGPLLWRHIPLHVVEPVLCGALGFSLGVEISRAQLIAERDHLPVHFFGDFVFLKGNAGVSQVIVQLVMRQANFIEAHEHALHIDHSELQAAVCHGVLLGEVAVGIFLGCR